MKIAIIGASGKTGTQLVRESLARGHEVVAVCRDATASRLDDYRNHDGFTLMASAVVSDEATLAQALVGCDAVVAILISVRRLKATELVASLAQAAAANGVKRLVFTAGEVTTVLEEGESLTFRQRGMSTLARVIIAFTPYSIGDMIKASILIREQTDWAWTIMRAPTLRDLSPGGYRLCEISEVTSKHILSRADYAACMLDSLGCPEHHQRTLTVVPAS